jgi:hypothetical protein
MAAMGRLRSWKRELFARAIAEGKEPKKAYIEAGFKPSTELQSPVEAAGCDRAPQ